MLTLIMNLVLLNMYQRLRDFNIPSAFLDEIFNNENDLKVLQNTWESLISCGLTQDETAKEISDTILGLEMFKEPEISDILGSIKDRDNIIKS